jgi:hypothetical protein
MEEQSITKEYLRIAGNLYGTPLKAYLALFTKPIAESPPF